MNKLSASNHAPSRPHGSANPCGSPEFYDRAGRYSALRRTLHWLSALVIIWATVTGFMLAFLVLPEALEQWLGTFNVALTLVFMPFFLLRLWLALTRKKPPTPALTTRQVRLAAYGHGLIYGTVLTVLVSGVSMMERPVSVFALLELPPLFKAGAVTAAFSALHHYACALLALLVLGHIAAVIVHQRRGVRLMQKML